MRALAPTLLLLASPALAGAPSAPVPAPVSAPTPVSAGTAATAPPAPVTAPVPVQPSHDGAPAGARAPEPIGPAAPGAAAPAVRSPSPAPVVPTQALVEKLGQGDRLFLAADYRNALFAYQDAVYMQPRYAPGRVKLGRAYLALRYPAQAVAQAEAALAADPENADAKKLLEEAKNPPARASVGSQAPAPQPEAALQAGGAAAVAPSASGRPASPRVFRFTPEPDATPPMIAPPPAATPPAATERIVMIVPAPSSGAAEPQQAAAPASEARTAEPLPAATASDAAGAGPAPSPASAAQHYRAALVQLQNREWAKAVSELSNAILADPKLAVAHAARGSAYFGLGKYREAAEDYRGALLLDPKLATPAYGLAECYRMLGDAKHAVEMYERYVRSSAADVREDLRTIAAKRAQELR
jgi:tetratricopeptide (TPR) repeat protein